METITRIKIEYETELGDGTDKSHTLQDIKDFVDEHIDDYCREHNLDRDVVKIIEISDDEKGMIYSNRECPYCKASLEVKPDETDIFYCPNEMCLNQDNYDLYGEVIEE